DSSRWSPLLLFLRSRWTAHPVDISPADFGRRLRAPWCPEYSLANRRLLAVSKHLLMKHDRRQDILEAAMELFAKKGFRGTTTRDLASQAEVNEAIIFRHFTNKEELYSAILEHKADENREAMIEELERLAETTDDE